MSKDVELEQWQLSWSELDEATSDVTEPEWTAAFRSHLAVQSRRRLWGMLAPVATTAIVGGYLLFHAIRSAGWLDIALAIEGWVFIAAVWTGCLWFARATWKPLSEKTAAFVELAIRRAQANRATARLGFWLLCAQLAAGTYIEWRGMHSTQDIFTYVTSRPLIAWGWGAIPIYALWLVWYQQRNRANLQHLVELRRQLLEDSEN